ncbi:MAG: NAD-dependent epimerase/dehydratase family protein [Deltaproteobacteria bacterium]|nr:NAD-dependent epimerase/dehydratase family protein [Deltaproteobacteria bacterium]
MRVLVTGISGALGREVTRRLVDRGHSVVGIDVRPWYHPPEGVQVVQTDIRKRPAEDVFRTMRPEAMIHMATVTHLTHRSRDRYRINLGGTQAVFDHCATWGVRQAVFVGRHTYYGVGPDSALYHTESEPPMAVHTFPELSDLVASDLYAGSALWRYPAIDTSVLRLCYRLGPLRQGTLAAFLRGPRVPTILGFDPLFHFVHEYDAADAIVLALESKLRGVFNVAGPPPVPLSVIVRETGRQAVPLPQALLRPLLGRFGLPKLPPGALEHVKYPIVIDGTAFRKATGFAHHFDEDATMAAFCRAHG